MQQPSAPRVGTQIPWQFALAFGVLAGAAVAHLWPSEPAYAQAGGGEKFTVFTVQIEASTAFGGVATAGTDGIFVLDHLTGLLVGNVLNQSNGKFTVGYQRNVYGDFPIDPSVQPVFAVVSGAANLNSGRVRNATSVIYIAELTSGVCNCYSLPYATANRPAGVLPINPLTSFVFKQAA
ncbi:MAG: hypothetical protein AAF532_16615 [Planctomycetota bacterium]